MTADAYYAWERCTEQRAGYGQDITIQKIEETQFDHGTPGGMRSSSGTMMNREEALARKDRKALTTTD